MKEQRLKKRMLSLVIAAVVAGPVALGVAPAQAATSHQIEQQATPRSSDIGTFITAISTALSDYQQFLVGEATTIAATKAIIQVILNAEATIISHIDAIATAQAQACAEAAVVNFQDFQTLTLDNQQAFALDVTNCVTLIDSLLTAVADPGAVDQLGFALNSIGPIALITRASTGLADTGLITVLVHSNQTTLTRLAPACSSRIIEGRTQWTCHAYNGDQGGPEPSFALAQREAAANTSWALSNAVLPTLNSL